MVQFLDHKNPAVAERIYKIFQASYAIEAQLLGVSSNFPPLQLTVSDLISSTTSFHGVFVEDELAAVVEIYKESDFSKIDSLVVHPDFFRRGLASKLVQFVFDVSNHEVILVETGADNLPAIRLYEKFAFQLERKYMTTVGIEKVAFRLVRELPNVNGES